MESFNFYITRSEDFEPSVPSYKSQVWLHDVKRRFVAADVLIYISSNTAKHRCVFSDQGLSNHHH